MKPPLIGVATLLLAILILRFVSVSSGIKTPARGEMPCRSGEDQGDTSLACSDLQTINQIYLASIKPIFEAKCLMCHGVPARWPLYAVIPPSNLLIKHDLTEAKKHLDMTFDYPFASREHDLMEQMDELEEVVKGSEMPPLIYKAMHWRSGLSDNEKATILAWVDATRARLQAGGFKGNGDHEHHHHDHDE